MAEEKKNEAMSDDELDQIIQDMSKEDELATAEFKPAVVEAAAPAIVADPAEELSAQETQEAPQENLHVLHAVKADPVPEASSDQTLKMELQGVVNLKVNFSSGGRSVELICSEEALVCRMADGTEFRIPLNMAGGAKRNAA